MIWFATPQKCYPKCLDLSLLLPFSVLNRTLSGFPKMQNLTKYSTETTASKWPHKNQSNHRAIVPLGGWDLSVIVFAGQHRADGCQHFLLIMIDGCQQEVQPWTIWVCCKVPTPAKQKTIFAQRRTALAQHTTFTGNSSIPIPRLNPTAWEDPLTEGIKWERDR